MAHRQADDLDILAGRVRLGRHDDALIALHRAVLVQVVPDHAVPDITAFELARGFNERPPSDWELAGDFAHRANGRNRLVYAVALHVERVVVPFVEV